MNNQRRKELDTVINILNDAKSKLESIIDDEQCAFDNLPEGLQCSERGEQMESAIDNMNDALDNIDEVISCIEEAQM